MFYAGAGLGKGFSYLTVVDEMGKVVRQGRSGSTPEGLLSALSGLGPQLKVATPATRAWQWAPGVLAGQGLEVTLAYPYKTRAIASARRGKRPARRPRPGPDECGQAFWPGPMCPTPRPGPCASCCAAGPSW